jgi:ribosome-interacting GTPase 1
MFDLLNYGRRIKMPANLPPQYYELEKEFKAEKDPREKLRLAKELLAMMPKHKGTDKLQAELKAKISKLSKQIDGDQKIHGARTAETLDHIEREGAAQVILIGPPNSGKSSIVDAVTNARPQIGDYPYTTRQPQAGMMIYETIQIQLVDTPPISPEYFETYLLSLIRQADLVIVVVDVTDPNSWDGVRFVFEKLEERRVRLVNQLPEKTEDVRYAFKKTMLAGHKYLDENGDFGLEKLRKLFPEFTVVPTSILDDESVGEFKVAVFKALNIIRVYTKPLGKEADFSDPVILPVGGTVEEAALALHKDFVRKLQYARLWGQGKFEGQRVKSSFVLSDGDIIEFHI